MTRDTLKKSYKISWLLRYWRQRTYIDEDGYVSVMGRNDDLINTARHRLSTGGMEEILMDHPDVADAAVIGVNDELKGEVPVGFVVAVAGSTTDESELRRQLIERVRQELGPVASFKKVGVVKGLPCPKTRSGKILRGTMRRIGNGQDYTITPTIEDPTIFERLEPQIKALVQPRSRYIETRSVNILYTT